MYLRYKPSQSPRRTGSNGGFIVRRRQQGRPPGGRQRAEPGRQGAGHPLRLPRHRHNHRLAGRGDHHHHLLHRGASEGRHRRLQGETDPSRHLDEGLRRAAIRRPPARPTRSAAPSSRASTASTPRRSPSSSATRGPRASRPRSRATRSASAPRSATTCRPFIAMLTRRRSRGSAAVRQLPLSRPAKLAATAAGRSGSPRLRRCSLTLRHSP